MNYLQMVQRLHRESGRSTAAPTTVVGANERHARLFGDRNEVMAERISARMKYVGGDFFAVGAGHLVGERNLLDALRARGFTMRRLVPGDAPVAPETAPEEAGSPTRSERPGRAGESGQAGTTP